MLDTKKSKSLIEQGLELCMQKSDQYNHTVWEAMQYSLMAGGKRIRPVLLLAACDMLGGDIEQAKVPAAALEMIHTYSLIHDDLPCMDDDDMRRGKPTNHVVYGYSTALLAGDALLTKAFLVAASNPYVGAEAQAEAVRLMADLAGEKGMIGGQIIDLCGETKQLPFETLLKLHAKKTGALMECAASLGALAAGFLPDTPQAKSAVEYARKIGLAFQVIDDILDVCGNEAELSKTVGADATHHKTTFLTYFDIEGARRYAATLTEEAKNAIADWEEAQILTDLAEYLLNRTY